MNDYQIKLLESMQLKGFAKSTKKSYLAHFTRYVNFCKKHPASCSYDDVRRFLNHEIAVRKLSLSTISSAYGAIKLYYETSLCREWNPKHIPKAKKRHFLPQIVTLDEVNKIIEYCPTLKYKAIVSTIYSAGLRISEVTHLLNNNVNLVN